MGKTNTVLAGLMRTEENLKGKAKELAGNKPPESKLETVEPIHNEDVKNTSPNNTVQKAEAVK